MRLGADKRHWVDGGQLGEMRGPERGSVGQSGPLARSTQTAYLGASNQAGRQSN